MKFILKLKHWKIMVLIFLPALLVEILSTDILNMWHILCTIWALFTYLLWLYLVGINFSLWPKKNLFLFKSSFFFVNVYSIYLLFASNSQKINNNLLYYLPFHLLALAACFYMVYFAAKSFAIFSRKENDKEVTFLQNFLCFWFFPIGVFILQPKINKYIYQR
jgi:hypothetical protein